MAIDHSKSAIPKPQRKKRVSQHYENVGDEYRLYPDNRKVHFDTPKGRAWYRAQTLEMAMRQEWVCGLARSGNCIAPYGTMTQSPGSTVGVTFEHGNKRGAGKQNDDIGAPGNCAAHLCCNNSLGSRRINNLTKGER